jgi:hypothetical protein
MQHRFLLRLQGQSPSPIDILSLQPDLQSSACRLLLEYVTSIQSLVPGDVLKHRSCCLCARQSLLDPETYSVIP